MKKQLLFLLLFACGSLQTAQKHNAASAATIYSTAKTAVSFQGEGRVTGTAPQQQAPQAESFIWAWTKKLTTMALGTYPGMIASVKAAEAVCRLTGRSTIPYANYVRAAGALAGMYAGYRVNTYGVWQSIKDVTTIVNNPYVFPIAVTAGTAYAGSLLTPNIAEKALKYIAIDLDEKYITLLTQSGAFISGGLGLYFTTFYKLHSKINNLITINKEIKNTVDAIKNDIKTNHKVEMLELITLKNNLIALKTSSDEQGRAIAEIQETLEEIQKNTDSIPLIQNHVKNLETALETINTNQQITNANIKNYFEALTAKLNNQSAVINVQPQDVKTIVPTPTPVIQPTKRSSKKLIMSDDEVPLIVSRKNNKQQIKSIPQTTPVKPNDSDSDDEYPFSFAGGFSF